MKDWINNCINSKYNIVKYLSDKPDSKTILLKNNELGKYLVYKNFSGNDEVYNILKQYTHKNIPLIYDVVKENNSVTVFQEFIDGITVFDVLQTGVYSEHGVKIIILQICNALCFLHSHNIIHRDIKPENIIITNNGNVKLIDFNVSKIYRPYQANDTKALGTTGFAAPEQFGFKQSDFRTDIFSLGILMNIMLTGQHPSAYLHKGKFTKLIEKCTAINPDKRCQTIEELIIKLKYL